LRVSDVIANVREAHTRPRVWTGRGGGRVACTGWVWGTGWEGVMDGMMMMMMVMVVMGRGRRMG
jgi:hypothetical protein